jgi:hypothetical protein
MKELIDKWDRFLVYRDETNRDRVAYTEKMRQETTQRWNALLVEDNFRDFIDWLRSNEDQMT